MEEEKKKISSTTAHIMVGVAFFFDIFQLIINIIPIFGFIFSILVSITAFITFFIWFTINGVSFVNPKRAQYLGLGFLIEIIPILNILPSWTLTVTLLIHNSNKKKKLPKSDIMIESMQ